MKTIKELEADLGKGDSEQIELIWEAKLDTLKDVLGLIDEKIKYLKKRQTLVPFKQELWYRLDTAIANLEELKKRIKT